MSSSWGKQKRAKEKSLPSSEYPSAWSDWEWDEGGNRWLRYRLDGAGLYEYDYHSPTVQDQSASPTSQPFSGHTSQSGAQQGPFSYTTAPVYGVATNDYGLEHQDKSGDQTGLTRQSHITTSNARTYRSELDKDYKVHPPKAFKMGRVFKVLWSELDAGEEADDGGNRSSGSFIERELKSGGALVQKVRKFLIVKQYDSGQVGCCTCLPVTAYGGKAITKEGIHVDDHAEIYSGRSPFYASGEGGMTKRPIRLSCSKDHKLVAPSLLNYGKVYTVEHNVKVCFIGQIDAKSEQHVATGYNDTHPALNDNRDDESPKNGDYRSSEFARLEQSVENLDPQPFIDDDLPSTNYGHPGVVSLSTSDHDPHATQSISPNYLITDQESSAITLPEESAGDLQGQDTGEGKAQKVDLSTSPENELEASKKPCTNQNSVWKDYVLPATNVAVLTYLVGRDLGVISGGPSGRDPDSQSRGQRSSINSWLQGTGGGGSQGSVSSQSDRMPDLRLL